MHLAFSAQLVALDAEVLAVVGDLSTYPQWLGIVQRVEVEGDDAWFVDLGARAGLLRATKRVRMVRVPAGEVEVRYEREETDGEEHSAWVLAATVRDGALHVDVTYGGSSLLVTMLEPVLRAEASRAPRRLQALLDSDPPPIEATPAP